MINIMLRILYPVISGPLVIRPVTTTASDSTASKTANSRGAVPGPNANPRIPGRSFDATKAVSDSRISDIPP